MTANCRKCTDAIRRADTSRDRYRVMLVYGIIGDYGYSGRAASGDHDVHNDLSYTSVGSKLLTFSPAL